MKKIILILVAVFLVVIVGGAAFLYSSLGRVIKKGVEAYGPQILQVNLKLDSVSCSPLSGSGEIRGLVIGNPLNFKTPHAIKVDRTQVSLVPSSVFSNPIHIKQLVVEGPEIIWEGDLNSSNLTKIQQNVEATIPSSSSKPTKLIVDELKISKGNIRLSMSLLEGKALSVPLPEIVRKDIGKDTGGVTVKELCQLIAKDTVGEVAAAAAKAVGDLGKATVEEVGKVTGEAGKTVEKVGEGLKSIFK